MTHTHFTTLISAQNLDALMQTAAGGGAPVVIFDCRFDLANPAAGEAAYVEGHIFGAFYAHLERDLSGKPTGKNGRHPLPERDALVRQLAACGLSRKQQVVAYDAQGGMYAARLWWLLRWLGHESVAVLDGGDLGTATDPCSCGIPLRRAYELTGDDRFAAALAGLETWALERAPRRPDGVVFHEVERPRIWVDSFFMLPPFLADAGHLDAALTQVRGYWAALHDERTGLLFHMWNEGEKRLEWPNLWATGNGWGRQWPGWLLLTLLLALVAIVFLLLRLALKSLAMRMALTPGATKSRRVRRRAILLFRTAIESRTATRTGVLLYLSIAEHRAEIVTDAAIHAKVSGLPGALA